jgi:hypothetical protein
MKRSSCLSALLVGLSLTTASAALAAPPPGTTSQPVKQVAQVQPADLQQDPTPSTGTPSTTPAPAEGESATTQPAVSIGTSPATPATDTPATSAPETAKKPKPRPFAGSSLYNQNSVTTATIFQGQNQYSNPTVESNLYILPRYAINEAFQVRARTILSYEYTNADSTTYRNEPMLSDTTFQLFYRKIPKLPLGVIPSIAVNVGLPTSKLSRSRTLVFSPGATLQLVRPFEHFLGGEAMILASTTYSHPIYQSRNPEVVDDRRPTFSCVGGNNCQDLVSGSMNPSDALSYVFMFEVEWGKWAPAIMYLGSSQWTYQPKEVLQSQVVPGGANTPVGAPAGFTPTSVRQTHYVSLWLDYNFNSWFTGEIGYWNAVTGIDEGGKRSNLIFDRYQDTRVYLGCSIQLDNLVKTIQGGSEGEGGVVRAKNTKTPMFTF